MRGKWLLSGVVGLATLAGGWQAALAQGRGGGTGFGTSGSGMSRPSGTSGGGQQGMFGQRNLGGSIGNPSRTFAGGRQGGRGGMANTGGLSGFAPTLGSSQLSGSERFLRENRQGQFVGADLGDIGSFIGAQQGLSGQFNASGTRRRSMNRGNAEGRDRGRDSGGSAANRRTTIPRRVEVAFEYPRPAPARLTAVLERRLTRMEPFSSVDLRVEGGAAVLRGQVATEDDRLLAENLVRLEPGVSAIRNEITIAGISRAPATEAGGSAAQARVP